MKIHRIYAMTLRHFFVFRKNLDHLTGVFYWPAINLLLWGITSSYFESQLKGKTGIVIAVVSGIIFWMIAERGNQDITFSVLQELWDRNLISIFATPLTFAEWVASFFVLTFIKTLCGFFFAILLALLLYHLNIFLFGFLLIPFGILLMITGWSIGCAIAALILRYGTKVQALAWTVPAIIAPFSAIYYPLSILPPWAQAVSRILPTSYLFEGMRQVIHDGTFDARLFFMSAALNIAYIILAILLLRSSFHKALRKGLLKIY